jgi:GNAT superfamily N-acetyltransferase
MLTITQLEAADRPRWTELWRTYLQFYETTLPDGIYDHTWSRLLAGRELHGLAARADGQIVGITHFLFHPSAWTLRPVCYLQDLFTDSAYRGQGAGRALIAAVGERAKAEGSPRMYWLTQDHNATARALYDKVAKHSGFIRYEYPLT